MNIFRRWRASFPRETVPEGYSQFVFSCKSDKGRLEVSGQLPKEVCGETFTKLVKALAENGEIK